MARLIRIIDKERQLVNIDDFKRECPGTIKELVQHFKIKGDIISIQRLSFGYLICFTNDKEYYIDAEDMAFYEGYFGEDDE